MDWAAIKPVLMDVELYTSLLVNIYAVLFAVTFSVRWLFGRMRKVTLPPSDAISSALSDAFGLLVLLGLAIASLTALYALAQGVGFPGLGAIYDWFGSLFS